MDDFSRTMMGRKYFTKDLPALIESNNRLAIAIEKQSKLMERRIANEHRTLSKHKVNESNKGNT